MGYVGSEGKEMAKTKEKRKYIMKYLKRGKTPAQVIEMVMEEFGLEYNSSYQLVYSVNREIKESLKELYDDTAQYLTRNLQGLAEEAIEDKDRKSAMRAYELLAKIHKIGSEDGKMDITLNFGFDFTDKDDSK